MSTPINEALVASQVTRSSDRTGAPDTRLRGPRLFLTRVVWITVVSLIVVPFLAALPSYYTALQTICTGATCGTQPTPDFAQAIQKLGLSVSTYATFTLMLYIALALVSFTLGAVIFWRKSDDWMALLVALAVVASAALNGDVYSSHSIWEVIASVLFVIGSSVYVLVLALFPDGRFVPRWTRWLLPWWIVAALIPFIHPFYNYGLVWHAAIVLLVIAQFYRYRTASNPLQRQQTKWLLFGGCTAAIIIVGLTVLPLIFPSLGQAGSFFKLVSLPAYLIISYILPLCFGIAILRYRLYGIDIIIHRTLVYSTLTVMLALIYEGSVFTLQSLLSGLSFIRGNQVAIVASTFLIGGLFKPLYDRIRALIDRRFYRRKYDAAKTLAAFSETIRDEVDLNQLCAKLTAVVEETMQPAHVSLWLCSPKRYNEKTTQALPIIDIIDKP